MPRVLKVVLLGDGGVGKTSLRSRFLHNTFTNTYRATIGADFLTKEITLDNQERYILQIWDTAGQERFNSLGVAFYRGADGCLVVYDCTSTQSYNHLSHWIEQFTQQSKAESIVIVANKSDKIDLKTISIRSAREFAKTYKNAQVFETSAKDGSNVEQCFGALAEMCVNAIGSRGMDEFEFGGVEVGSSNFSGNRRRKNSISAVGRCCY